MATAAAAQEGDVGVLFYEVEDVGDRMVARVYADAPLEGAQLLLDGEAIDLGEGWQPLTAVPFHVVILYDASGSVQPAAAEMRAQADAFLDELPVQAQVAIYRFNDKPELEYAFGPKGAERDALMAAIDELQAENDATCLYDALSHVVTAVSQVVPDAPRRAVLLMSDGRDEKIRGEENRCSINSEQDVIAQANGANPPVPIFALGVEGTEPVDEAALRALVGEENGRFALSASDSESENSEALFDNLIAYFTDQWLLEVDLFTSQGDHLLDLTATTEDGDDVSLTIPFTSPNEYRRTPPPERIRRLDAEIESFRYNPRSNQFESSIIFSDPDLANQAGNWFFQITNVSYPFTYTNIITFSEQITDVVSIVTETLTITTNAQTNQSRIVPVTGQNWLTKTVSRPTAFPDFVQPGHFYEAELIPPTIPLEAEIELGLPIEKAVWQAPKPVIHDVDYHITGLFPSNLLITYTLEYEEYVDQATGYLWDESRADTFIVPISPATSVNRSQYVTNTQLNRFKTYSLTTYFQKGDATFIGLAPEEVVVDNRFRTRLNQWINALSTERWMNLALLLLLIFLLIGVYLFVSSRPKRPLPAPAPLGAPAAQTQFSFRVVESPDAAHAGQPVLVDNELYFIGREGCNFNLSGDRQISRRHVAIEKREDGYYIKDLDSRNGTFVDEKRLNAHQWWPLHSNSEVQLGRHTFLRFT